VGRILVTHGLPVGVELCCILLKQVAWRQVAAAAKPGVAGNLGGRRGEVAEGISGAGVGVGQVEKKELSGATAALQRRLGGAVQGPDMRAPRLWLSPGRGARLPAVSGPGGALRGTRGTWPRRCTAGRPWGRCRRGRGSSWPGPARRRVGT
jgi:hypothetical protein